MRIHQPWAALPTLNLVTLVILLAGCSEPPPVAAPLKIVRTMVVGAPSAGGAAERSYPGEVHARVESNLGFRIPGKIVARLVDAGAVVKAGQALARLDAADSVLQANASEAQRGLAEAEAKRYRNLKDQNFISQAALDARETTLKAADAQAALAQNQSAYTTLVADRAGVIAAVSAETGQVVSAGQTVVRLAADGEREVVIAIPESALAQFKPGMAAEVSFWAGDQVAKTMPGVLREIAPAADAATRTYPARISLPQADPRLPLGLTATVRFKDSSARKELRVPLSAIFQQGSQPAVWIVDAGETLKLQPVNVVSVSEAGALIDAGLQGGERIVAAGVHQLTAGEKVRSVVAAAK